MNGVAQSTTLKINLQEVTKLAAEIVQLYGTEARGDLSLIDSITVYPSTSQFAGKPFEETDSIKIVFSRELPSDISSALSMHRVDRRVPQHPVQAKEISVNFSKGRERPDAFALGYLRGLEKCLKAWVRELDSPRSTGN